MINRYFIRYYIRREDTRYVCSRQDILSCKISQCMQPWTVAGRSACNQPLRLYRDGRNPVRTYARIYIDTHMHISTTSRCFLGISTTGIFAATDGRYKRGRTHISDRSGTFAYTCLTSADLMSFNDAIADYNCIRGTNGCAAYCFRYNPSIRSSGASRFHRKTDDGVASENSAGQSSLYCERKYISQNKIFSTLLLSLSFSLFLLLAPQR